MLKYMVCNREGRKNDSNSTGKRDTLSDRCGCKAKVKFAVQGDGYVVTELVEEHNHKLMSTLADKFSKSNVDFNTGHQTFVVDCGHARIGPVRAYKLYEKIVSGAGAVDTNVVQFKNCKRSLTKGVDGADAQMVVNKLKKKKEECSAFYYNHNVDEEGRLTMLFWADPACRKNCAMFGEIVVFDSTYRTNR